MPAPCLSVLQNFYPGAVMTVTLGNLSCSNVTITAPDTLTAFTCIAPPALSPGDVHLRVWVSGGASPAVTRLPYDPPDVMSISPSPCQSNASCPVTITGTNLGLRGADTGLESTVFIGGLP